MLERVVAVIGPPAAGKTTLTVRLGRLPGCSVFRLREHVPETMLAATATSPERLGWLDEVTVTRALRGYLGMIIRTGSVHTILLDNFPGSGMQARLLGSLLGKLAPQCVVHVVELRASANVIEERAGRRRVCHQCERDPIHDPRLPAAPSPSDPGRCARCRSVLHPRRGDAPRLLTARTQRYYRAFLGICEAFSEVGTEVLQCDADHSAEETATELSLLLATRSAPL